MVATNSRAFSLIFSAVKETLPIEVCMIPYLSTLKSIFHLHFFNCFTDFHGNRTTFGIRHQSPGTQDFADTPNSTINWRIGVVNEPWNGAQWYGLAQSGSFNTGPTTDRTPIGKKKSGCYSTFIAPRSGKKIKAPCQGIGHFIGIKFNC